MTACGGSTDSSAPSASERSLSKPHSETAHRFAKLVVAKDYEGAFQMMSEFYRTQVGKDEFLKSISRYRDGVTGGLKYRVRAGEAAADLKEDTMVELMVPEAMRGRIQEEVILDFDPEGDLESWTLVAWLVDEGGTLKILNYYQDD